MKPEQQRIAIAEACGWENLSSELGVEFRISERGGFIYVKDPLNDLNAMHEAEKVLTEPQQSIFADRLNMLHNIADLTYPDSNTRGYRKELFAEAFHLIHATAAQRAEAFLRTLNLWMP